MAKAIPTMLAQLRLALTKVKLHEKIYNEMKINSFTPSLRNKHELPSPTLDQIFLEHLFVTPKLKKMLQEQL